MWAIDARIGPSDLALHVSRRTTGFHIGHRGVAVYKDLVYLTTPDAHLVALDARDRHGAVERRDRRREDAATGRRTRRCVIRNHLIVGVSGDFDNLPGILQSFDPETGKPQWTFYSTPPPGTPGSISGGATGGQMWMTGTYDPELNLLYVGTGNPTPVLNGPARPGDNQWTGSIVALNPDTGKLAWGFQASPHDTHDWDAAEVPVLVDADFNGTPRKLLLQASRNGYYFVLDRTTGKNLLTTPFATVNWAKGIDEDGRPDSQSRQGTGARRPPGGAERGRRHQLPIAELRSRDRAADRQRARRLRHLLLQAGARRVRLGGRRLHRVRPRRPARDRLPDRQDPLEPRSARRRRRRRRADDRDRRDVHRRLRQQRAGAAHERRHDAVARRASAASATRRSPTSSTAASTCCSAAAARSTRSRCLSVVSHRLRWHSAGDASVLHPTAHSPRGGGPGAGCVAHRSNIPDMLALRALPSRVGSRATRPGQHCFVGSRLRTASPVLGAQRSCETRH